MSVCRRPSAGLSVSLDLNHQLYSLSVPLNTHLPLSIFLSSARHFLHQSALFETYYLSTISSSKDLTGSEISSFCIVRSECLSLWEHQWHTISSGNDRKDTRSDERRWFFVQIRRQMLDNRQFSCEKWRSVYDCG